MALLLQLKGRILAFIGRYDLIIRTICRFAAAFLIFLLIRRSIGGQEILNSNLLLVLLAAACAFLPAGATLFIGTVLILLDFYVISPELTIVAFLAFVLWFFLYFRFASKKAVYAILCGLLSVIGIPFVMPLAIGLRQKAQNIVSALFGLFVYFILADVRDSRSVLEQMAGQPDRSSVLNLISTQILGNREMYLFLCVFLGTAIFVATITRLSVNHIREIAVISGGLLQVVILGIGELALGRTERIPAILIGVIVSTAIAYLISVLGVSMDYSRVERVQFEDDEYYYYVKAVPKVAVAVTDKQVETIHSVESTDKDEEE